MVRNIERVFKAASDSTRFRILCLLENGPLCVCQIVGVLGLSQSTVSKHLSILENAGLIYCEKHGKWSHYGIRKEQREVRTVLDLIFSASREDGQIADDQGRLETLPPIGDSPCAVK